MATFTTDFSADVVHDEIQAKFRKAKQAKAVGTFLLEADTVVAAASYDVINDKIELLDFPTNTNLLGVSIIADKEYDTGGTAVRFGLVLDDGDPSSFTSVVGAAFANQPANDGVSVLSSSVADTTQSATIYGTTTATDTVVVEVLALNGTTVVDSVKTDWGQILAIVLDAACAGTVTLEESSANADIKTLAPGVLSYGVNSVTSTEQDFKDALVRIVASGASTKQIGLKGTDTDGTVIYDSQALSGTTQVFSNSRFATVTEVYTGDLENTVTGTISSSFPLLATASQFATADPIPLNWAGAALPGAEYGVDCGGQTLSLLVEAAPTTANTGNVTFTTKALVSVGGTVDLQSNS